MKSINFKKSKKWILLIVVAAILLWTFVPMIICDVVVGGYGISGSSEYFSFGVYEYYIANSAIGFKKKIHKPYISIDGRDIPWYYTKVDYYLEYCNPDILSDYWYIKEEYDHLMIDSDYTTAKFNDYIYYLREGDSNNYYRFSLTDKHIIQIPYSRFNEYTRKSDSIFILAVFDYYDGLYECMMRYKDKNELLSYIGSIALINNRVFFSSRNNEKANKSLSKSKYNQVYDIYEYDINAKSAVCITTINNSKYGYPTVIAVK